MWDINRANHKGLTIKEWQAYNDWNSYSSAVIMYKKIWKKKKKSKNPIQQSMNHCNASE